MRLIRELPWRSLALMWLGGAVVSALVAQPIGSLLGGSGANQLPAGDAQVFAPGGFFLLEALAHSRQQLGPLLTGSVLEATFLGLLLVLFHACALGDLQARTSSGQSLKWPLLFAIGLSHFPRFSLVGGLATLTQAALVIAATVLIAPLTTSLEALLGARGGDLCVLTLILIAGAALWCVGVIRDIARARSLWFEGRLMDLVQSAVHTARASWRVLAWQATWRATSALALIVSVAQVTTWVDVAREGDWRLLSVFGIHQGTLLVLCWLRLTWHQRCLELTRPAPSALTRY